MLSRHDRERPEEGRAAELPDPQARARVRRRPEPAARGRLQVPARDPRGPRHVRAREGRAVGVFERIVQEYTPGEYIEDWDVEGLFAPGRADLRAELRRRTTSNGGARPRRARERLTRTRCGVYERARGGARRGPHAQPGRVRAAPDHRPPAGASTCSTWTTCGKASTCAASRRRTPDRGYKNEGFTLFRDLMNSIWEDFARYIFHVELEIEPGRGRVSPSTRRAARARRAA